MCMYAQTEKKMYFVKNLTSIANLLKFCTCMTKDERSLIENGKTCK